MKAEDKKISYRGITTKLACPSEPNAFFFNQAKKPRTSERGTSINNVAVEPLKGSRMRLSSSTRAARMHVTSALSLWRYLILLQHFLEAKSVQPESTTPLPTTL